MKTPAFSFFVFFFAVLLAGGCRSQESGFWTGPRRSGTGRTAEKYQASSEKDVERSNHYAVSLYRIYADRKDADLLENVRQMIDGTDGKGSGFRFFELENCPLDRVKKYIKETPGIHKQLIRVSAARKVPAVVLLGQASPESFRLAPGSSDGNVYFRFQMEKDTVHTHVYIANNETSAAKQAICRYPLPIPSACAVWGSMKGPRPFFRTRTSDADAVNLVIILTEYIN